MNYNTRSFKIHSEAIYLSLMYNYKKHKYQTDLDYFFYAKKSAVTLKTLQFLK